MAGSYFPRDLLCDVMVGGAKSYWCQLECQSHDVRLNQKADLPPRNSSCLRWAGWVPPKVVDDVESEGPYRLPAFPIPLMGL